jgi:hydrogenase/urease accessory protein HupE
VGVVRPAVAHEFSPGFLGLVETAPDAFTVQWKVSLTGGLADTLSPQLPDACTFTGDLRGYVMGDARVQERDIACAGGLAGREIAVGGLAATMTDVLLRVDYLSGESFTQLLTPSDPATIVAAAQTTVAVIGTYLVLGTEHILLGIDHLLFVLALLLLVGSVRRLVVTVTAFTVAHSVTLGAATLGLVNVPQAPVEAVIALSILFLAAELGQQTLGARPRRDIALEFPWIVAFVFGLLHGFGFAGALAEVGLPEHALPLALLFFNVGVELGQLLFVFAVLGLAWIWRRAYLPIPRLWRGAAAYGLGSVAAFWVIDRTIGAI